MSDGSAIVVPGGAEEHNVINVSDSEDLKFYTIYSSAHHKDGIVRATKSEIDSLLDKQFKKEFLQLFQDYQAGSNDLNSLAGHFKQIADKIRRAQLSFKELEPFTCSDFFSLQSAIRKLESQD